MEYQQRENEICDRIRGLSDQVDQLTNEGKDATEILQKLEAVLEEFRLFRHEEETELCYQLRKL